MIFVDNLIYKFFFQLIISTVANKKSNCISKLTDHRQPYIVNRCTVYMVPQFCSKIYSF